MLRMKFNIYLTCIMGKILLLMNGWMHKELKYLHPVYQYKWENSLTSSCKPFFNTFFWYSYHWGKSFCCCCSRDWPIHPWSMNKRNIYVFMPMTLTMHSKNISCILSQHHVRKLWIMLIYFTSSHVLLYLLDGDEYCKLALMFNSYITKLDKMFINLWTSGN